jgi:hypothetical protein
MISVSSTSQSQPPVVAKGTIDARAEEACWSKTIWVRQAASLSRTSRLARRMLSEYLGYSGKSACKSLLC